MRRERAKNTTDHLRKVDDRDTAVVANHEIELVKVTVNEAVASEADENVERAGELEEGVGHASRPKLPPPPHRGGWEGLGIRAKKGASK